MNPISDKLNEVKTFDDIHKIVAEDVELARRYEFKYALQRVLYAQQKAKELNEAAEQALKILRADFDEGKMPTRPENLNRRLDEISGVSVTNTACQAKTSFY